MAPCPTNKRGVHHLMAVVPARGQADMTLYCDMCGATLRFPVTGPLVPADRLDDAVSQAEEAMRRA